MIRILAAACSSPSPLRMRWRQLSSHPTRPLVGLAARALRGLLPARHHRGARGRGRRRALRADRRGLLSLPPRLRPRRGPAGRARGRARRGAEAAGERPREPARSRCRSRSSLPTSSIGGAMLGLALPAAAVQVALGITILGIVAIMAAVKNSEYPGRGRARPPLQRARHARHASATARSGREVDWQAHRTPAGPRALRRASACSPASSAWARAGRTSRR